MLVELVYYSFSANGQRSLVHCSANEKFLVLCENPMRNLDGEIMFNDRMLQLVKSAKSIDGFRLFEVKNTLHVEFFLDEAKLENDFIAYSSRLRVCSIVCGFHQTTREEILNRCDLQNEVSESFLSEQFCRKRFDMPVD